MLPISTFLTISNPMQSVNDMLAGFKPISDSVESSAKFTIHHPILSILIVLLTLFLLTGLVQKIMEWSRNFWDYVFIYSGRSVELIFKGLWTLIVFVFRLVIKKRETT